MKKLILINLIFINILFANNIFKSDEEKTNLIELYTSQGCNSCPPADEWLSNLKVHPNLFKEFIPLAFHVTYWNYIGWEDIFSKKSNDIRQRHYSTNIWEKDSVYSPQFVVDAKEYREWFYDKSIPSIEKSYGGNLVAKLNKDQLKVTYLNKEIKNKHLFLNTAILGFNYKISE